MAVTVFTFSTLAMPAPPAHAIGPVLKVVGGEALDQVMQGMAYKLGASFNDETAKDKARGRWNLDGYQKAQDYENKLNAEEKARWDKFNSEVSNAPIQPTGKPGIGKILISGAAFLTGADLIYNSYKAYQAGVSSGEMEVADYDAPAYNVDYGSISGVRLDRVGDWSTGGAKYYDVYYGGQLIDRVKGVGSIYDWGGYLSNTVRRTGANSFAIFATYKDQSGHKVSEFGIPNYQPVGGLPSIKRVAITPNDMGVVPSPALDSVPRIEGTSLPNPSQIILPNPDTMIEIEVPLEPGRNPGIQPLTDEEWDKIINPGDIPDPNKPPGDDVEPDKPPGTVPPPDMDKPPVETPEYPEEVTDPDGATTGGLFSKLFEWLKALLDALFKILNAILAIPSLIINALKALLLALFVPTDGFWDDNVNDLRKIVTDELDTEDLIDNVDDLGGVSGGQFRDVIVSLMGVDNLEVIDADSVNKVLDIIHKWVRGVVFPFLIFYNINQLYKLIRGTSLVEATRNLNRVKGE